MYRPHRDITELQPAPLTDSVAHRRALTVLSYGVAQGEGMMLLTGGAGTGKSALAAELAATVDRSRTTIVSVIAAEGEDVLRQAALGFGIAVGARTGMALIEAIEQRLEPSIRAGRRTLLIVDRAEALPSAALDALRILSSRVQILLVGGAELRERLKRPELWGLRQRAVADYDLDDAAASPEAVPQQRFTLVPQPQRNDDDALERSLAALKQQLAVQEAQLQRAMGLLLEKAVAEEMPFPAVQLAAVSGRSSAYNA